MAAVWKFGYGSNMSQEYMRKKKGLNPLDSKRTILRGFRLSFPQGAGIDLVEPAFAMLKRDPEGMVHGVSTLIAADDAARLDKQESGYNAETLPVETYEGGEMQVQVYVPKKEFSPDHPETQCSKRYQAVLLKGAEECDLHPEWIAKLRSLPTYTPSAETLAARSTLPHPSELPQMSIDELRAHNGEQEAVDIYSSSCGYVFKHEPRFVVMRGRDITFRNVLHVRGLNLEEHDDGGKSPFPRLSQLAPDELDYALQYRDRFHSKAGAPVAVLREFWQEQEPELEGVFRANTLSQL